MSCQSIGLTHSRSARELWSEHWPDRTIYLTIVMINLMEPGHDPKSQVMQRQWDTLYITFGRLIKLKQEETPPWKYIGLESSFSTCRRIPLHSLQQPAITYKLERTRDVKKIYILSGQCSDHSSRARETRMGQANAMTGYMARKYKITGIRSLCPARALAWTYSHFSRTVVRALAWQIISGQCSGSVKFNFIYELKSAVIKCFKSGGRFENVSDEFGYILSGQCSDHSSRARETRMGQANAMTGYIQIQNNRHQVSLSCQSIDLALFSFLENRGQSIGLADHFRPMLWQWSLVDIKTPT
eukprot:sb/3467387/